MDQRRPYADLARKLCAAAISHRLGLTGVDYTLKRDLADRDVGDYWYRLAQEVDRHLAQSISDQLRPGVRQLRRDE